MEEHPYRGVELPLRTITDYLKRWGFTPQKPAKRAYEQNPKAVQQWLDSAYPEIVARAKQEKAEIHWGDETGVQSDAYNTKGFSPKGKTPVIRLNAKKSSLNMVSAITNQGKVRFMLYQETMTTQVFIKFLSRLVKDAKRKVFLILDNHRVHHSKIVKEWLEQHKGQIELFFLPSYSPELNPDEYLNGNLKQKIRSGMPARALAVQLPSSCWSSTFEQPERRSTLAGSRAGIFRRAPYIKSRWSGMSGSQP